MATTKRVSAVEQKPNGTFLVTIPPHARIEASAPPVKGRPITSCTLWDHEQHILGPVTVDLSDPEAIERVQMMASSQNGRVNWIGGLSALGYAIPQQGLPAAVAEGPTGPAPHWPVLAPEALHGLAGEAVRIISPHTEADPIALLIQLLNQPTEHWYNATP